MIWNHLSKSRLFLHCEKGIAALEFVLIAPALLILTFAIIFYSFYFSAFLAVRQIAAESARASVAGLSFDQRKSLADSRASTIIGAYGSMLSGIDPDADVNSTSDTANGTFTVEVRYDFTKNPIYPYRGILPVPNSTIVGKSVVTNGSY